jgi:thiamine-phosphate pyrophosphorylase
MRQRLLLPKIYPITDRELSGRSHIDQLQGLIDAGATFIQIREKNLSSLAFFAEAKVCVEMAKANGVTLIINDRVDIALALSADGVHLGQDDLPPTEARLILGNDALIGFSTHSVEQAISGKDLPVDYIAIGPIFSTKTKLDHDPPVGLAGISKVREAVGDIPIVAIGGIKLDDIPSVLAAGADSVALISALTDDPENYRRAMQIADQ